MRTPFLFAVLLGNFLLYWQPLRVEATPPANVQARTLPAEVLLTWDASPDAASYRVFRGGMDRRWAPASDFLVENRFRDTDFTDLPSYYHVAAYDASGQVTGVTEILVSPGTARNGIEQLCVAPLSDDSILIAWYSLLGASDAMLELGAGSNAPFFFAWNTNLDMVHSFVITNLVPGTQYWFRLTSTDASRAGYTYRNTFVAQPYFAPMWLIRVPVEMPYPIQADEDQALRLLLTADETYAYPIFSFPNLSIHGFLVEAPPIAAAREVFYVPCFGANLERIEIAATTDYWVHGSTTVSIQNHSRNHAPYANDLSLTVAEDGGGLAMLSAMDHDSPSISYFIVSGPTNGILRQKDWVGAPSFNYFPNTNFNGIDHFTYAATDGALTGNVATVRIRVLPVYDPPTVANQSVVVYRGAPTNIVVRPYNPDHNFLVYSVPVSPRFGTIVSQQARDDAATFLFTPVALATNNVDSFTYTVTDGRSTSTATVTIQLVPNYDQPVANSLALVTESNQPVAFTLSGSAPSSGTLTYYLMSNPQRGQLSGVAPQLTYAPARGFVGSDHFEFRVSDGRGLSSAATVTISVVPPARPTAPANLVATALSHDRAALTWSDTSSTEKGFRIERSTDQRTWKQVASTTANTKSFVNTGLAGRKTYFYRICAWNAVGVSDYSNIATVTTPK